MAEATGRKLITHYAQAGDASIDNLVKESGIWRTAQAIPSTHGSFHKFKQVIALPSGSVKNIGGGYSSQTVDDRIVQLDLKTIGAVQSEDKDLCEEIGVQNYFKRERPVFIEGLGQTNAKVSIYGNNASYGDVSAGKGIHQYCSEYHTKYSANTIDAGGTTNTTSLLVVKYKTDKSGICFNSKTMAAGEFIKQEAENGGNWVMVYNSTDGKYYPKYQVLYTSMWSWLSTSRYDVARIIGIDSSNKPTSAEVDQLIDYVKGTSGDTVIYGSRAGRRTLWDLKTSKMQTISSEKGIDNRVEMWNGIPVVVEENILDTETKANL